MLYKVRKKILLIPLLGSLLHGPYMVLKRIKLEKKYIKQLEYIKSLSGVKIYYLDTPVHPNLGDLAQYMCIKQWLERNYPQHSIIELSADFILNKKVGFLDFLKNTVDSNDRIFFQSGYCTQDFGGTHDEVHRVIVNAIHNTPIIMLPQTILFKDKKNAARTANVYEKNKNLLIMCRDKVSYHKAETLFKKNEITLYPDIVTSLIGKNIVDPKKINRKGILICSRNDCERYYSEREICFLRENLRDIDEVTISDTTLDCDYTSIQSSIKEKVNEMIKAFSKYKVIITDRYHGTIFALIAGTPVIVIRSNDHKVTTGVNWFKGIYDDSVFYEPDMRNVEKRIKQIYSNYKYHQLEPYFETEYYAKLKDIIENWIKGV